ncbi:hypothetical protein MRX96_007230 [Rhipicephalus microplus]
MNVRIGSSTFKALLDTGSSVSFFGPHAAPAAQASEAKPKADVRVLCLASGWSQSTISLKCLIECHLGGWTVGTEPQRIVPFVKAVMEEPEAVDDFGDSLRCVFAEDDASVCASVPEKNLVEIFTTTPGCTTLAEYRIYTGDNPLVRCKLRPVNSKKQAIMDHCIHDLLAQNLIRPSQSQHARAPFLVEMKSAGYHMARE